MQALCSDPDDTNWFKRLDDTEWFLHIRQILLGSNRCVDLVSHNFLFSFFTNNKKLGG